MFTNSIKGKVVKGYQVASGYSKSSPYPQGSIKMQLPFFKERGLDLYRFYPATLNISIFPKKINLINPEYTFRDIKWYLDKHAENFSFSKCKIIHKNKTTDGYIYYPRPETKTAHIHDESTIEIITTYIGDIYYGSKIEFSFDSNEVSVLP